MVAKIDWEERCWQLSHDVAVRLAIEARDSGDDPVIAAGEAVSIAVTTCEIYRQAFEMTQRNTRGQE